MMKNTGTLKVTTPTDWDIVMTRDFDAPLTLVWEAMTKPELIKRWLFAPPGWSMTVCEEDVRVGGSFRWEWAGPDGETAMVLHGVYREVVPPERIVRTETFEFGCAPQAGEQLVTLILTESAAADARQNVHRGRTTLTLTVHFPSREARDAMLASGMEHGVAAGYDRLEEMLASKTARRQ